MSSQETLHIDPHGSFRDLDISLRLLKMRWFLHLNVPIRCTTERMDARKMLMAPKRSLSRIVKMGIRRTPREMTVCEFLEFRPAGGNIAKS
jgi:hypothetical protein